MEEKSLKETLAEIAANQRELLEKKKVKKWNIPFTARIGMGKKAKRRGKVVFMNIGQNKAVTFIKAQLDDGVAMVNDVPHVVEPDDILIWKNKIPLVIQPQWSERPFSAKDHYDKTIAAQQHSKGWQYIMNYIYKTQIKAKKNVPIGLIVIGGLALIGLGYYLIKSGAFAK